MKKLTKIASLIVLTLMLISCKNDKSLQSYFVDSQEKPGFSSIDFPVSSLFSSNQDISDEMKETIKSIRKINVVFLQKKDNEEAYEAEKTKLKSILSSKDFKSLGSVKAKGMNVKVYYTGDTDSIDEVIAFGYGKEAGVGVARLLGENMNPAKIIEMMNNIKIDGDNVNLEQFSAIFKGK